MHRAVNSINHTMRTLTKKNRKAILDCCRAKSLSVQVLWGPAKFVAVQFARWFGGKLESLLSFVFCWLLYHTCCCHLKKKKNRNIHYLVTHCTVATGFVTSWCFPPVALQRTGVAWDHAGVLWKMSQFHLIARKHQQCIMIVSLFSMYLDSGHDLSFVCI